MARLVLAAALFIALALAAIFALFASGGMAHADARATSPDGAIEARAERQGGSMQFPSTSIYIHRRGGADCVVVRWSAKGSGRESGAIRAVTLTWRDDRTLLIGADVPPPFASSDACGILVLSVAGEIS